MAIVERGRMNKTALEVNFENSEEEARTEALNSENQKKVRSSSNHCVLRGYQHQVGTDKHRIASLFVVISNFGLFPKAFNS
jgi:hypothetical protein